MAPLDTFMKKLLAAATTAAEQVQEDILVNNDDTYSNDLASSLCEIVQDNARILITFPKKRRKDSKTPVPVDVSPSSVMMMRRPLHLSPQQSPQSKPRVTIAVPQCRWTEWQQPDQPTYYHDIHEEETEHSEQEEDQVNELPEQQQQQPKRTSLATRSVSAPVLVASAATISGGSKATFATTRIPTRSSSMDRQEQQRFAAPRIPTRTFTPEGSLALLGKKPTTSSRSSCHSASSNAIMMMSPPPTDTITDQPQHQRSTKSKSLLNALGSLSPDSTLSPKPTKGSMNNKKQKHSNLSSQQQQQSHESQPKPIYVISRCA